MGPIRFSKMIIPKKPLNRSERVFFSPDDSDVNSDVNCRGEEQDKAKASADAKMSCDDTDGRELMESTKKDLSCITERPLNRMEEKPFLLAYLPSFNNRWKCPACLMSNDSYYTQCPSCQGTKPAGKTESRTTPFSNGPLPHPPSGSNSKLPTATDAFAASGINGSGFFFNPPAATTSNQVGTTTFRFASVPASTAPVAASKDVQSRRKVKAKRLVRRTTRASKRPAYHGY